MGRCGFSRKQRARWNMTISRLIALPVLVVLVVAMGFWGGLSAQSRTALLTTPVEGEIVQGPNVTFTVESTGIRLPEEHFHLLLDGAALRYVLGNPVPLGQVDIVHFRANRTTIRFDPGPHFVVLIATDNDHVPLRPWTGVSRYFFVR